MILWGFLREIEYLLEDYVFHLTSSSQDPQWMRIVSGPVDTLRISPPDGFFYHESLYACNSGRGEPIRLALSALQLDYDDLVPDYATMKADAEHYPCAQCPRFKDEDVDIVQSTSIMRHIGRKHGMYGTGLVEAAAVDMIIDAVESLKTK